MELCKSLLAIADLIEPGQTRFRGQSRSSFAFPSADGKQSSRDFFLIFFFFFIYGHQASHCTKCTPLCVCCSSRHLNRTRSRPMNSKKRPVRFAHCSKRLWPSCKLTVYFPFILLTEFCMYLWLWVSHFNCQDVDR